MTFTATLPGDASGDDVDFYADGWYIGSGTFSGSTATFTTSALSVGTHSIFAYFWGDQNYSGTWSNTVTQVVVNTPGLITYAPPPPGTIDYSYTITPTGGPSGYAANGNLLSYTDWVNGTWSFGTSGYDSLNRLVGGSSGPGPYQGLQMSWSYDSFGNRTSENLVGISSTTAQYNANNQVTGSSIGYDPAGSGNVTYDNANQYLYDGEGRVCAVRDLTFGSMTEYIYDAEGTRVAKGTIYAWTCDTTQNSFALTNTYIIGPSGEQLTETDGSGNWLHTNVYAAGQLMATYGYIDNSQTTTDTYFALSDWLGTKRAVVSAGGCGTGYASLPYGGGLTATSLPGFTQCPDATEHHFTGKERDSETGEANGNDYFGARYYSSSMGRFLSPDPIFGEAARVHDPQQWNMYAYARNNPLAITDPTGMDENIHCGGDDSLSCHNGWDGLFQFDKNGILNFVKTDVDMNQQGNPSAGYHDQWNNQYTGTFDQNNGVSFTNTATGETSTKSQFIDGSDPTQLIGAQTPGSAFAGMRANFFDACGPSSSCQGRFTLYGTTTQFNTMESTLHPQGGFKTFLDGFSGAHPFFTDQWKGGGPNNDYVHMISAPHYRMDGHFEGSTDPGIHAFSTIKDLVDGAAFGERGKLVRGQDGQP